MKKTPGDILFEKIEKAQGYAYISDGISDYPKEKLKELVSSSKSWHREAIRVLNAFERKYLMGQKK